MRKPGKLGASAILKTIAAAGICVVLSACVTGSTQNPAANANKSLKIVFVSNLPAGDPFGSIVVNGFKAAVKDYGISGEYRGLSSVTYNAADQVTLINNAIAEHPDALITTDPAPSGLNATIKRAVAAGIPLVITNQGEGQAGPTGALTFIGNNETFSGQISGQRLAQAGVKHPILFTFQPGIPLVDARDDGFSSAFPAGAVTSVALPVTDANNTAAQQSALMIALQKNPNADAVFSVGSVFNAAMLATRAALGPRASSIQWTSIDLGSLVVSSLQKGEMAWALNQQQWLEGYYPVQTLVFYLRYHIVPARDFIPVGPAFVTPQTIGPYLQAVSAGVQG